MNLHVGSLEIRIARQDVEYLAEIIIVDSQRVEFPHQQEVCSCSPEKRSVRHLPVRESSSDGQQFWWNPALPHPNRNLICITKKKKKNELPAC